jgi:hypothetical protein
VPDLITGPHRVPAEASPSAVALLSARDCVESKSYRTALSNAQAPYWQAAVQQEYFSLSWTTALGSSSTFPPN